MSSAVKPHLVINIHLSNCILMVGPSLNPPTPPSYPSCLSAPSVGHQKYCWRSFSPCQPPCAPPPAATHWGPHHLVRLTGFGKGDCGGPAGSTPAPRRYLSHRPSRWISLLSLKEHAVAEETGAGAQSRNQRGGGWIGQVDLEGK